MFRIGVGVGIGIGVDQEFGIPFRHKRLDDFHAAFESLRWVFRTDVDEKLPMVGGNEFDPEPDTDPDPEGSGPCTELALVSELD